MHHLPHVPTVVLPHKMTLHLLVQSSAMFTCKQSNSKQPISTDSVTIETYIRAYPKAVGDIKLFYGYCFFSYAIYFCFGSPP